jgi:hypothetical protein
MTIHKTLLGTALSLVVFTLAGCKSNPAPPAETNTATTSSAPTTPKVKFNPCNVLTPDEVTAITTDKVSSTERIGPDCHYHTTFEEDGTVISIYPTGGKEQMDDTRKAMELIGGLANSVSGLADAGKKSTGGTTNAPPALGDEAFWEPNDKLAVRKGDLFVEVTPTVVHDPASHHGPRMISNADKRAMVQKLAEAVLAKLAH